MPIIERGFPKIEKTLRDIDNFQKWATPAVEKGVDAMEKIAKVYAPEVAGSKYERTGDLGRDFDKMTRANGRGVTGTVFSTGGVDYMGFVKVAGSQTAVHARNQWKTDVDDLEKAQPVVDAELDKAAKRMLR